MIVMLSVEETTQHNSHKNLSGLFGLSCVKKNQNFPVLSQGVEETS